MAQCRCTVERALLVRITNNKRALRLELRFDLYEPGPPPVALMGPINHHAHYPPLAFRGLTLQQAKQLVQVTGVGGVPPLDQMKADILQDWNDGAVIRQIPDGYEFGP